MRRTLDVVVASLGLVLGAPVFIAIALVIGVQLGWPVLFRQVRAGRGGCPFSIVKFRTMRPPAYHGEADAVRTPPIGHLLRSTSLDELPQLWNVLVGDMSFLGPRPTLPEQVVHYDDRQRRRLEVRPGITGYAQVKGRNTLSWPERIELDVWYIDHRSVLLDLWILSTTVVKLLRREGVTGDGGVNQGFPVPHDAATPAGTAHHSPGRPGEGRRRDEDRREVPDVVD